MLKGFGFYMFTPISGSEVEFVGYAFVDNSDLVQTLLRGYNHKDLIRVMQQALNSWEGSLSATSGAIVPQKTFWYLVDFAWSGGNWRYKRIGDCPGRLMVKDIQGNQQVIRRVETDQVEETLGILLAPDGNRKQQIHKMRQLAIDWI
jgi:hypothetical protein